MTTTRDLVDVHRTRLPGVLVLLPRRHTDERGFFEETYRKSTLSDLGIDCEWVQVNHSRSTRGVVRGLHLQLGDGQAKLVRCAHGAVYDVVLDLRRGSPTYAQWEAHELDDERGALLYVPVGFAHGFCVTSDVADVTYSCSAYYDAALERRVAYDDPELGIEWPVADPVLSDSDAAAPPLSALAHEITFEYAPPAAPRNGS